MTIVCALHFSDRSLAAVKVAAQRARLGGEGLWLVDLAGAADRPTVSPALERAAAELSQEGLTVRTAALAGPPSRVVQQFCSAKQASLLVVGDSQQTLGPLLVGPLDRFADRLHVPVLIVRDAGPFETWETGRPLRVLLALDRTWRSTAAREWIARLATYGAIELLASYLWWPRAEDERQAQEALSGLPPNVRRCVRLDAGRPRVGPQLLHLANAERADVVVLGTHPHHGPVGQQWSVSHELLALAPMSVACIPEALTASSCVELHGRDEGRLLEQAG